MSSSAVAGAVRANPCFAKVSGEKLPEVVELFNSFESQQTEPTRLAEELSATGRQSSLFQAQALEQLGEAKRLYANRSYDSAEQATWSCLELLARAADLQLDQQPAAGPRLHETFAASKQAILEAQDFSNLVGRYGNPSAIHQLVRSHRTPVAKSNRPGSVVAEHLIDEYLDSARQGLAELSAQSVEAADALDLLARLYLRRDKPQELPGPTALCLRRAALQGQPGDAELAMNLGQHLFELGLIAEARRTLEHSLSLNPQPKAAAVMVALLEQSGHSREADHWRAIASGATSQAAGQRPSVDRAGERVAMRPDTPAVTAAAEEVTTPAEASSKAERSNNPLKRISDSFRKFW